MAVRAEVHHHWAVARGNHPDRKPSYCLLHESRYNAALAPSTTPSPSTSCTTPIPSTEQGDRAAPCSEM